MYCVCASFPQGHNLAHFQAQVLNSSCLASRCIEHPVFFARKKVQIISILPETCLFKQAVMAWKEKSWLGFAGEQFPQSLHQVHVSHVHPLKTT